MLLLYSAGRRSQAHYRYTSIDVNQIAGEKVGGEEVCVGEKRHAAVDVRESRTHCLATLCTYKYRLHSLLDKAKELELHP